MLLAIASREKCDCDGSCVNKVCGLQLSKLWWSGIMCSYVLISAGMALLV